MKRWIVRVNQKELVCELVTAFVQSQFKLKLKAEGKIFMIQFRDRDIYLEAKEGGWRKAKVYTVNKEVVKWGEARFTEYYKLIK